MAVALIQGASRGIGLEFVKQLRSRPNTLVIACCRDPDKAEHLRALDGVHVVKCDVTVEKDIKEAADKVLSLAGKVDFLLNSSGILHPSGRGETRLQDVTLNGLYETFAVNTFGPLMMAKHFAPLLKKGSGLIGSQKFRSSNVNSHSGILANMSARVGSISDNHLGGWYTYRMSKAALNMANKNLSIEFLRGPKRIICLALHPGTTDTDLSRPYHKGVPDGKLFSTQFTVSQLMGIIDDASLVDSGRYIAWDGTDITF